MEPITIWRDDFELRSPGSFNDGVKSSCWSCQEGDGTDYGIPGWGNGEWQAYQSCPDAVKVRPDPSDPNKGRLVITAIKHPQPVPCPNRKGLPPSYKSYTSARLTTKGLREFGWSSLQNPNLSLFVEARIKLPVPGKGLWPAFWMLPAEPCPTWPESGEIDVMEAKNDFAVTTSALHMNGEQGGHACISGGDQWPFVNCNDFHVFGVEWNRNKIRFYRDGSTIHEVQAADWNRWYSARGNSEAPFNKPFYLLLNLAVGGQYPGVAPEECTWERAEMVVDWIHVYTKQPSPTPSPSPSMAYEIVAFRFTTHNPDSTSMLSETYSPDSALAGMFTNHLPEPYKIVLAMEGRTIVPQLPRAQQHDGYGRLWALLAPVGAHCHKRMLGGRTDIGENNSVAGTWGIVQQADLPSMPVCEIASFLGLDRQLRRVKAFFKPVAPGEPGCAVSTFTASNGQINTKVSEAASSHLQHALWGPGIVCWNTKACADAPCDFSFSFSALQ